MIDVRKMSKKLGYHWFTGPGNLNLYAIRSVQSKAGRFDDILGIAGEDEQGEYFNRIFVCTVDPGIEYLKNFYPGQTSCAVLAPGFYRGAYSIGTHIDHEALVQVDRVDIYRDGNSDETINPGSQRFSGLYGINIHSPWFYMAGIDEQDAVGSRSAGCIVTETVQDHSDFMSIVRRYNAKNPTLSLKMFTERSDGI